MKDLPTFGNPDSDERLLNELRAALADTVSLDPTRPPELPRFSIPGYVIVGQLSTGGQGVVYVALQEATKRQVAIKVLLHGAHASASTRKRFQLEIEMVAQLQHPNIISIFTSGQTEEGLQYFVMDFVRGKPLHRYIRENQLDVEQVLELFAVIGDAVQAAHDRGIVHRDLKPSNILVDNAGRPRILDFGIAMFLDQDLQARMTLSDHVVGTLPYMSPEQVSESPIDHRTDIYSLGIVLYRLLTGTFPYEVDGEMAEVLQNIKEAPAAPPRAAWTRQEGIRQRGGARDCPIDKDIHTIVLKTLAKDPERRYASARELASDVRRYVAGEPIRARGDSMAYVLGTRGRKLVQRHRVSSYCVVMLIAVLLGRGLGSPVVFDWTPCNRWFEQQLTQRVVPLAERSQLQAVRLVTFSDAAVLERLAARVGIQGVTAENKRSFRRLHGRLMAHLVGSGCRAVMWDITFRGRTAFDDDLLRGIEALRQAGVDVVVGVKDWPQSDGLPAVSPTLVRENVRWGGAFLNVHDSPATALLLIDDGINPPLAAMTLAGLAAAQRQGESVSFHLDPAARGIDLAYSRPNPEFASVTYATGSERIELSSVRTASVADAIRFEVLPGAWLGFYRFLIPSEACLSGSTVPYAEVFDADEPRLRTWFQDKVIVIGDLLPGVDRHATAEGRQVAGCHAQATALDALLSRRVIRTPGRRGDLAMQVLAALLGIMVGRLVPEKPFRRLGLVAVLAAALCGAAIAAYQQTRFLVNPAIAIINVVAAAELAAALRRIQDRRKPQTGNQGVQS